jgi:hypothetical protein
MFQRDPFLGPHSSYTPSPAPSIYANTNHASGYFPKKGPAELVQELEGDETEDLEKAANNRESLGRPLILTSAVFVGLAMTLLIVLLGLSVSRVRQLI